MTSIGEQAFHSCESLSDITLPDSLTSIEDWAFNYCTKLDTTLPSGLTSIGTGAFDNVKAVKLPESIKDLLLGTEYLPTKITTY